MAVPTRVGPAATSGSGTLRHGLSISCMAAGSGPSALTRLLSRVLPVPASLGEAASRVLTASTARSEAPPSALDPPVPPSPVGGAPPPDPPAAPLPASVTPGVGLALPPLLQARGASNSRLTIRNTWPRRIIVSPHLLKTLRHLAALAAATPSRPWSPSGCSPEPGDLTRRRHPP